MAEIIAAGRLQREDALTDQQVVFLKMVERRLRKVNADRLDGDVKFYARIKGGNVADHYVEVTFRDKQ